MARRLRVEYPGAVYHVMNRGNQGDYGEERKETAEARAEGIVREELKRLRWREEELGRRTKGDAGKVARAARLRRETVMTVP